MHTCTETSDVTLAYLFTLSSLDGDGDERLDHCSGRAMAVVHGPRKMCSTCTKTVLEVERHRHRHRLHTYCTVLYCTQYMQGRIFLKLQRPISKRQYTVRSTVPE